MSEEIRCRKGIVMMQQRFSVTTRVAWRYQPVINPGAPGQTSGQVQCMQCIAG